MKTMLTLFVTMIALAGNAGAQCGYSCGGPTGDACVKDHAPGGCIQHPGGWCEEIWCFAGACTGDRAAATEHLYRSTTPAERWRGIQAAEAAGWPETGELSVYRTIKMVHGGVAIEGPEAPGRQKPEAVASLPWNLAARGLALAAVAGGVTAGPKGCGQLCHDDCLLPDGTLDQACYNACFWNLCVP